MRRTRRRPRRSRSASTTSARSRSAATDRRLILVRHAAVELRPDQPAAEWELSGAGRAAAARLAELPLWRGLAILASSPEPKALATAEPIAVAARLDVRIEPGLREAGRPTEPIASREEYVERASAYLDGAPVAGWEPAEEVRRRVCDCIERLLDEGDGAVAVVSHGLALGLFLGLTPAEWARIPLPAVAVADAATRELLEPWSPPSHACGPSPRLS